MWILNLMFVTSNMLLTYAVQVVAHLVRDTEIEASMFLLLDVAMGVLSTKGDDWVAHLGGVLSKRNPLGFH